MTVSIVPATDADRPVVANLIQLYLYDMTDSLPFPVGSDGRFEYDFFERFWQHPYLIHVDDELAGFAFVIDESPVTGAARHFMAEFFVLKAYRGRGVGRQAAEAILARHPGPWQLAVITQNAAASAFWASVLAPRAITPFPHRFDGEDWQVYDFDVTSR
ncbi:GNAT family N-acetyltransferase [Devosia sp.]|uniref:GNAT family N-acetyltransferase n=1 Tax=Devosia sp. TaxID=1871048 RepID=UPI003A9083D8